MADLDMGDRGAAGGLRGEGAYVGWGLVGGAAEDLGQAAEAGFGTYFLVERACNPPDIVDFAEMTFKHLFCSPKLSLYLCRI